MLVSTALITVMCISIVMLWIIVIILISHIKKNTLFLSQLKSRYKEDNIREDLKEFLVKDIKEFDNKVVEAKVQAIADNKIPSLDKYVKRRI